ncbi:MAG TPA: T9SS type A sorting domain-containing protein, partial [Chitinophagales bacterium]|nr:T9SS type A sorting domain-containing protein [Chitinophagales bacterium]
FNSDGLQDIVIGNYGYFRPFQTYKGTLAYYENIGTASQPRYKMRSEDYNNFSNYLLVAVHPAFGDLDGDGYKDMVVGELTGYLHFFKNTGGPTANFSAMTSPQFFNLDAGQYSAPFIYDVNNDGLQDLIVGRRDGKISYYWNFGTTTNPQFSSDSVNNSFGNINVTLAGLTEGYSQPSVFNDGSGTLKLFVGSARGNIFQYAINPANLRSGSFTLIDSDFLETDLGSKATISIADVNADGLLEYLCGNSRGGLLMYSDSIWNPETLLSVDNTMPVENRLRVYPNPAANYFVCAVEGIDLSNARLEMFNVLGEKVKPEIRSGNNQLAVSTSDLSKGFYILRVTSAGKTYTGKVLIQK